MSQKIQHNITSKLHSDIMPRKSWLEIAIEVRVLEISGVRHIFQAVVVEICAIPEITGIHQSVVAEVPTPVADVDAPHESDLLVDDDKFLVMAPE
jgi:hypothetical protein